MHWQARVLAVSSCAWFRPVLVSAAPCCLLSVTHRDNAKVAGLSPAEAIVLSARPRSPSHQKRLGYSGSWSPHPSALSNSYFKLLLEQDWKVRVSEQDPWFVWCGAGGPGLIIESSVHQRGAWRAPASRFGGADIENMRW